MLLVNREEAGDRRMVLSWQALMMIRTAGTRGDDDDDIDGTMCRDPTGLQLPLPQPHAKSGPIWEKAVMVVRNMHLTVMVLSRCLCSDC